MPFLPLPHRQNGKKKLPSFFGIDGDGERDTTTDKILQYIPGKASTSTSCPTGCIPTHPRAKGAPGCTAGQLRGEPCAWDPHGGGDKDMLHLYVCDSGGVQCGGNIIAVLSSLFLGRKGKCERTLKGRMIHSHAGMRRSRQRLSNESWEDNQEGQVCPGHVAAPWPYGCIPAVLGERCTECLPRTSGWSRAADGAALSACCCRAIVGKNVGKGGN